MVYFLKSFSICYFCTFFFRFSLILIDGFININEVYSESHESFIVTYFFEKYLMNNRLTEIRTVNQHSKSIEQCCIFDILKIPLLQNWNCDNENKHAVYYRSINYWLILLILSLLCNSIWCCYENYKYECQIFD